MSKVIDFAKAKNQIKIEAEKKSEKAQALRKIEPTPQSDCQKFNHDFYNLVDLFMRETYPDYSWRFDIWLNKIRNNHE